METRISRLGQGPGLAWKRSTSSFPPGSLAELQEWTGGKTEPVGPPPWHDELTFQQWNTVGWAITDDGILCIKPWEGDTGTTGSVTSYGSDPWYDQASKIKKIESTGTIVSNANSLYLFSFCSNLTDLTGLASWNVSNVTDMSQMFYYCSSLTNLTALEHWDVSNVTSMDSMFGDCSRLTNLTAIKDWDVSNVTDMSYMFSDCSSLTDLTALANWDVSKVTDMVNMFASCSSLTDLTTLSNWNVSNVTNIGYMFSKCSSLTDLTALKDWNVSNVMDMSGLFAGCSEIQKVGIPSIKDGGQKLVENAESSGITDTLQTIISEDGSMGPYTWDDLKSAMTNRPSAFRSGTVWVKAEEAAQ